jgi:Domain of unknown function (DUF1707)
MGAARRGSVTGPHLTAVLWAADPGLSAVAAVQYVHMAGEVSAGRGDEVAPRGDQTPGQDQTAPSSELRASHEDRDRVAEILRVAAGDGRLSAEELDERLGVALTARTYRELAALTADLPAPTGQALASPSPKDLVQIDCGDGSVSRDGRWVVPRRIDVRVRDGQVRLDFTEAVITTPTLQIHADVHDGRLKLVTRPGIVVDADDVKVSDGRVKVRAPWVAGTPVVLRVDISGIVHDGHITARPPRRNLWQWLLRRPKPYAALRAS